MISSIVIKFLSPKIKILKKLNLPFLLNLSSKYNYKLKFSKSYNSYYEIYLKFIRYICYNYCLTYKQYLHYIKKIKTHNTDLLFFKLLKILESRLDVILVNIGCFKTILQARHFIKYKHVYINNNINNYYYNIIIKPNDIIFFNNKIKYTILKNLIYKYNIYLYISYIYKYKFIKNYSYNNFFLMCIFNLKIKILYNIPLNNILYIYKTIYHI